MKHTHKTIKKLLPGGIIVSTFTDDNNCQACRVANETVKKMKAEYEKNGLIQAEKENCYICGLFICYVIVDDMEGLHLYHEDCRKRSLSL